MNSKSVKNILKTLLSLALGLIILWVLYRKTDIGELWEIIKTAKFGFIAISLLFGLIGNIFRGLRWELLINSLGYHPKRMSIMYATFGNYAVNFLLPRAGDVWRCGVVSKYDKIPFAKVLETFLVDKVIEIVAAMLIFLISVLLYIDFFVSYFNNDPQFAANIANLFSSVWIYVGLALMLIIATLMFTVFRETFIMKKIIGFLSTIKRDMKLIAGMKEKKRVIIYTILSWFSFYLYFYITFFAFDFTKDLGPLVGLIVFAMSNIGIAVPVQGGIGTWHFMVISSLVLFGVVESHASAFAGGVFVIQSVWVILCGVFGILALPGVKRDNAKIKNSTIKL